MHYKIEYIKKGKLQEIIISANSANEAIKKFREKKLGIVKSIEEFKKPSTIEELSKKLDLSKIDLEEYIGVLEQMHVMLDAGLAIDIIVGNIKESIN